MLRLCDLDGDLQAGNKVGAEGAKALAPELGNLTQLHTLDLGGAWIAMHW